MTPIRKIIRAFLLCQLIALNISGCKKQDSDTATDVNSSNSTHLSDEPILPNEDSEVASDDANTSPGNTSIDHSSKAIARSSEKNSPDTEDKPPVIKKEKRLWADSFLWSQAPELTVEKWLTDAPDITGKYVLIEFWATWCPPCRRSIPLLNTLHEKYGNKLVVIGVSEEAEDQVRQLAEPKIQYFSAIDTQKKMYTALGVRGIPHVILMEPGWGVVWEGFPLLEDYELTEGIVEKILAVGSGDGR
ncbi:MAG: TlpA family protein disulfide reductase [Phycisphaerae bacterium]|nr:TlpA family protein disulfide reductase [Phycisphaerae bacterium]